MLLMEEFYNMSKILRYYNDLSDSGKLPRLAWWRFKIVLGSLLVPEFGVLG